MARPQLLDLNGLSCPPLKSEADCLPAEPKQPTATIEERQGQCRVGSPQRRPANWFDYCDEQIVSDHVKVCRKPDGVTSSCGLVTADGELSLPVLYERVELLPGSPIARISLNNRWGYYDTERRQMVFAPQFLSAQNFSEGLAYVRASAEEVGSQGWLVGRDGNRIVDLPLDIQDVGPFVDGLARARQASLWGYLNREGQWVIKPEFLNARDFENGVASVQVASSPEQWALIDPEGRGLHFLEGASHRITAIRGDRLVLEWGCRRQSSGGSLQCIKACMAFDTEGAQSMGCAPALITGGK